MPKDEELKQQQELSEEIDDCYDELCPCHHDGPASY